MNVKIAIAFILALFILADFELFIRKNIKGFHRQVEKAV